MLFLRLFLKLFLLKLETVCPSHNPIQYNTLFHNWDIRAMKFSCWWCCILYRIGIQFCWRSQYFSSTQIFIITQIVISSGKQWVEVVPRRWSLQLKLSLLLSDSSLKRIWLVIFIASAMFKFTFDLSVLHRKFSFLSIRFKAFYSTLMLFWTIYQRV